MRGSQIFGGSLGLAFVVYKTVWFSPGGSVLPAPTAAATLSRAHSPMLSLSDGCPLPRGSHRSRKRAIQRNTSIQTHPTTSVASGLLCPAVCCKEVQKEAEGKGDGRKDPFISLLSGASTIGKHDLHCLEVRLQQSPGTNQFPAFL